MTTQTESIKEQVTHLGEQARKAALALALLKTEVKNKALLNMAEAVKKAKAEILKENAKDMAAAEKNGISKALLDRLMLDESRVDGIAEGLKEITALPDPGGEVVREWTRPNGIRIQQITVPLGAIGMIYEARPNVTAESAGLCLKSGNAVILRGGSEAFHSNLALVNVISSAAAQAGIPDGAIQLLPPQDRQSTTILSQLTGLIDLIIARGSEEMIKEVSSDRKSVV